MNREIHDPVLAGFAETDITPDLPIAGELIGFNRPGTTAQGVLHRLKAQVLLCRAGGQPACLIAIDSIGFTVELTNELRDNAALLLGAEREQVMVCFSHTHAAPDAAAGGCAYFRFALEKIMACIRAAAAELTPVHAAWGAAENTIGVNRRAGATEMDARIGILSIATAATKETKVLLLRVTAHANVLTSDNFLISSDYFGTARELLEQKYGCKVMLTQGASGNVRPRYRQKNADFLEEHPLEAAMLTMTKEETRQMREESRKALHKMAEELFLSVDKIYSELNPRPVYRLCMESRMQTFYADVPSTERAQEIAQEAAQEAGIDGTGWLFRVRKLHQEGVDRQSSVKEVQLFCVNDGCLCGVPDEVMCEIAVDVQKKSGQNLLFFGSYTNGYGGYLPSAAEYDRGGYEVLWSNLLYYPFTGKVMPHNRDTADLLADAVVKAYQDIIRN